MSIAPPQDQLRPGLTTAIADLEPSPSELLVAVRTLARSRALADRGLLRRAVSSGPATTRWYEPVAAGGLDAWLIWWSRGGEIDLHDHGGAAGAVFVLEGSLLETHGTTRGGRLQRRTLAAGSSIAFGADYVHDVINLCPEPAVSVHVYGPRLDAMTYYRVDERSGTLVPGRTEQVDPVPEARTRAGLTA